jgi:serine/threonine protein kinase
VVAPLTSDGSRTAGPYALVELLREDGLGQVFLGRSAHGNTAEVRVIVAELAADPWFRTRFRAEVAAAAKVTGPFVVPVIDADPDGDAPWLATAHVTGPSLAEWIREHGPLPIRSVPMLAAGLAEGLRAMHAVGVVHQNLNPLNVRLVEHRARLIDFGIWSAATASGLRLTDFGSPEFSPEYLSPEQVLGQDLGPASDIFSLGAVLVFACHGQGPFGTGTSAALMYRLVNSPADLGDLPDDLRWLIGDCLAKEPGNRPTAGRILAELGIIQSRAATLNRPVPQQAAAALPLSQLVAGLAPLPVTGLSSRPVTGLPAQPVSGPLAQPVSGPLAQPVSGPLAQPVTGLPAQRVTGPVTGPSALTGPSPQPLAVTEAELGAGSALVGAGAAVAGPTGSGAAGSGAAGSGAAGSGSEAAQAAADFWSGGGRGGRHSRRQWARPPTPAWIAGGALAAAVALVLALSGILPSSSSGGAPFSPAAAGPAATSQAPLTLSSSPSVPSGSSAAKHSGSSADRPSSVTPAVLLAPPASAFLTPTAGPSGPTSSASSSPSSSASASSSASSSGSASPSPSPSASASSSASDSPTPTDSPTDTSSPTDSPTDTSSPTDSPTDTSSPTDSPTDTTSPTDSPTDTSSPTDSPTDTSSPTDSPSTS